MTEVIDCPEVDAAITVAHARVEVLAVIRFPLADPLPDERDPVA